jgi:beta-lactamase regulating signal transducer with metallopeptidase domain
MINPKVFTQWKVMNTISGNISSNINSRVAASTVNLLQRIQVIWNPFIPYFAKVWIIGFLISISIIIAHYIYFHIAFNKSLLAYNLPITIRVTKRNTSPFVTGVFRKILILPQYLVGLDNQIELDYIIQHEMFHIKKKDNLVKMLYLVARCIHWFNPLVYLMGKKITMDIKMACDEAVAETLNKDEKIEYCNVLYKYCIMEISYLPSYSTTFSSSGLKMKERFDCILAHEAKSGKGILFIACLLVAFTSIFIGAKSSQISSKIMSTKLSYTGKGDILVESNQLGSITIGKMKEDSIIIEFTDVIPKNIDLKTILNTENIINDISKEDFNKISKLQFTVCQDNNR